MKTREEQIKDVLNTVTSSETSIYHLDKQTCVVLRKLFLSWKNQVVGEDPKTKANNLKRYQKISLAIMRSDESKEKKKEVVAKMEESVDSFISRQTPKGEDVTNKELMTDFAEFARGMANERYQKEGGGLRDIVIALCALCVIDGGLPATNAVMKMVKELTGEKTTIKTIRSHFETLGLSKYLQEKRGPKT